MKASWLLGIIIAVTVAGAGRAQATSCQARTLACWEDECDAYDFPCIASCNGVGRACIQRDARGRIPPAQAAHLGEALRLEAACEDKCHGDFVSGEGWFPPEVRMSTCLEECFTVLEYWLDYP